MRKSRIRRRERRAIRILMGLERERRGYPRDRDRVAWRALAYILTLWFVATVIAVVVEYVRS